MANRQTKMQGKKKPLDKRMLLIRVVAGVIARVMIASVLMAVFF